MRDFNRLTKKDIGEKKIWERKANFIDEGEVHLYSDRKIFLLIEKNALSNQSQAKSHTIKNSAISFYNILIC